MQKLQERLADWHRRAKGVNIDVFRTGCKLAEEVGELMKGLLKNDVENCKEEIADVFIVLCHLARYFKIDLIEEAEKKYLVLEERLREKNKKK